MMSLVFWAMVTISSWSTLLQRSSVDGDQLEMVTILWWCNVIEGPCLPSKWAICPLVLILLGAGLLAFWFKIEMVTISQKQEETNHLFCVGSDS